MLETDAARLRTLVDRSLAIIRAGQAPTGAYVASPTFPVYGYCWLRDGAFIADAMSRAGDVESAEAFFAWCARVLVTHRERIETLIAQHAAGATIPVGDFLHTRFTLDGHESDAEWENFQLDGYGTWLWALGEHCRRHDRPVTPFLEGALLSADYLTAFAVLPNYDWWEEHRDKRHTSTLAAIHAGLRAVGSWPEVPSKRRAAAHATAAGLVDLVRADATRLGHLAKWLGGDAVDASLLAVATPFDMFPVDDPLMVATTERIESELVHDGGVHRYALDTFYGGGEWPLLAALLGWHQIRSGRSDAALCQLEWVAHHASPDGHLPEQVNDHLLSPDHEPVWIERWGPVAAPLLWSHAMFLTLAIELGIVHPATPIDDQSDPPPVRAS